MRVREAQGNLVEALRVHERLRTLLRDELGVAPGPQVQAEFERHAEGRARRARAGARPAARAAPAPARRRPARFFATRSGAAFVGRRGELDRLRQYLERATEGNRQLVLLEGEPGIGKTRLAMEFMEVCEAEGALALYGRCDAETLVPYQPFVEALRRYVARAPEQAGAWRAAARRRARPRDPRARGRRRHARRPRGGGALPALRRRLRGAQRHRAPPAGRARARRPALGRQADAADAAPDGARGRRVAAADRGHDPRHRAPGGAGGHARAAAPRALLRPDRADAGSTRRTPPP